MPARLETGPLLDQLAVDGELLASVVNRADLGHPVAGLEWTVRDVLVHTGAVHRWATDIVVRALAGNETGGSLAFRRELDDAELADWLRAGHVDLLTALREAPDDLEAWVFSRGAPAKHFWTRRQAHETAVHRIDVELTTGSVTDVPADFAQDGIDELAAGFARSRAFATEETGLMLLAASDGPAWTIRFGGERIEASVDEGAEPDAVVSGRSSDLYRWLWNRPSPAVVTGDVAVADLWRRVRI